MTKSGLIEAVAERTLHISKKDTEIVVNTIFDAMAKALRDGERIEIRGFGSFQVKVREAREGRNPKTGEEVQIPAKRTPFFKVGKELKEMVDGGEESSAPPPSEPRTGAPREGGVKFLRRSLALALFVGAVVTAYQFAGKNREMLQ